ncbi:MAG: hypothetical protein HGA38_01485 [Candidatus Moranbacteria bacterium]|nr:hypothetical protein [Candidatus Moranbacteria bacterium]
MNVNPAAKRILCFGDSNTWGYIPGTDHQRYPSDIRWPGMMQSLLGNGYEIIEEGLNSRGIENGDDRPEKGGRSAVEYIVPCLDSHDPLDCIIVFLGSNELKSRLNLLPREVGESLRRLLLLIASRSSQGGRSKPHIVVVVPPVIDEETEYCRMLDKYMGAHDKSLALKTIFKSIAEEVGVGVIDMQDELKTGDDGVHLLPESHRCLAERLANELKETLKT